MARAIFQVATVPFVSSRTMSTPGPQQDDRTLTAEEIAALDLRGVEWAVLSACDTGLGEIGAGEGVFGLRRALQLAGARTVILSLWGLEDGAAQRWMQQLYRARPPVTTSLQGGRVDSVSPVCST
jgi:CHAT domain-containing protein